ncbi:MAG: hypothetical protein H7331_01950 [Bacteroidia bacterium]|nr:hypothetical protein [Bacteroidia bacterium]
MKKVVLSVFAIASMMAFVACGPSAEQKAATEKATQDSIAATEAASAEMEAAKMQAEQDSLAKLTVDTATHAVDAHTAH